jgi:hypothetical protein
MILMFGVRKSVRKNQSFRHSVIESAPCDHGCADDHGDGNCVLRTGLPPRYFHFEGGGRAKQVLQEAIARSATIPVSLGKNWQSYRLLVPIFATWCKAGEVNFTQASVEELRFPKRNVRLPKGHILVFETSPFNHSGTPPITLLAKCYGAAKMAAFRFIPEDCWMVKLSW